MKKTHKILISIIVIFSLCACLVWWQFGNIKALYYWVKYSDSDIDALMSENSEEVGTYLEENSKYNVRPSKPLEEELHKKGVIDDSELVSLITEQTTIEKMFGTELELGEDKNITIVESGEKVDAETANQLKQEAASNQNATQSEETTNKGDSEEDSSKPDNSSEISACIAQVYVIKANFVGQLDVIYNQAFSEYKALWRNMTKEQRSAKKKSLLAEVYPKAAALERDCDDQIDKLLSKLTGLLKDAGESTGLVDQIRSSYQNEKSLKKAHYLSLIT